MCGNRDHTTELKRILVQSFGAKTPFSRTQPVGTCIQLLLTMIQNAENVVPSATIAVENKKNQGGTRLRPKMRTPKNVASSMKAVKVSYIRSEPWIGPDSLDSSLQFVPNWNAIT